VEALAIQEADCRLEALMARLGRLTIQMIITQVWSQRPSSFTMGSLEPPLGAQYGPRSSPCPVCMIWLMRLVIESCIPSPQVGLLFLAVVTDRDRLHPIHRLLGTEREACVEWDRGLSCKRKHCRVLEVETLLTPSACRPSPLINHHTRQGH